MAIFQVRVTNDTFIATDDVEADDAHAAASAGIKGALDIAAEQIVKGQPFFAAEISIEQDGKVLERHMISAGTSSLM